MALAQRLLRNFIKLRRQNQLAHGYLLFGESAEILESLASRIAAELEHDPSKTIDQPLFDCLWLDTDRTEKGGIDAFRSAISWLYRRPVKSLRRTVVVKNADRATPAAQNAFLKIAEEPPEHALVILLARDPSALLPALTSRLHQIYVSDRRPRGGVETRVIVEPFLRAAPRDRGALLKEMAEDPDRLRKFVEALITYWGADPLRNFRALRALFGRLVVMEQFNLNRRLQLESVLLTL